MRVPLRRRGRHDSLLPLFVYPSNAEKKRRVFFISSRPSLSLFLPLFGLFSFFELILPPRPFSGALGNADPPPCALSAPRAATSARLVRGP